MKTEELKTKIEDCLPIENYGVRSIDCGGAGIDKAVDKLLFLFQSEIEAAKKAAFKLGYREALAYVGDDICEEDLDGIANKSLKSEESAVDSRPITHG